MRVMSRVRHAAIPPSRDDARASHNKHRTAAQLIQKNRCRTTVTEPIWGNASGTAPYRGSGRLLRPRPGRRERTCIIVGGSSRTSTSAPSSRTFASGRSNVQKLAASPELLAEGINEIESVARLCAAHGEEIRFALDSALGGLWAISLLRRPRWLYWHGRDLGPGHRGAGFCCRFFRRHARIPMHR